MKLIQQGNQGRSGVAERDLDALVVQGIVENLRALAMQGGIRNGGCHDVAVSSWGARCESGTRRRRSNTAPTAGVREVGRPERRTTSAYNDHETHRQIVRKHSPCGEG